MKLSVFKTYDDLSRFAAEQIIQTIAAKPDAVLCLATGETPRLTYSYIGDLAKHHQTDFSKVHFIGLDEWVGIPKSNPGSCYSFLKSNLFNPLSINDDRIHLFDALSTNLSLECDLMNAKIKEVNGIDLMLVGVGMNGHIGFNEPGVSQTLDAHVIELDTVTRQVGQKYFSEETVLTKGITLGLRQILGSRKIMMMANGKKKSDIISRALEDEISVSVPASLIRNHPNSFVLLDQEAARDLKIK